MSKTITQFRWLVTMLLLVTAMAMPKMAWAEPYDENGFAEDGSYQPATPTTNQYDINGDGTKDEVYEIGNAGQLYWFAALVNGDESVCTGNVTQKTSANAVLTKNIDCGYKTWTPIGVNGYEGTFDGQGHTISRLNFDNSELNNVGLFGSNSGTIKNVGVVNSYFYGRYCVGGVCGSNEGKITGCYTNYGRVSGNDWVGGVCGQNYGTITGCYNTGTASGNNWVGGVCGDNNGTISDCYNSGTVSGSSYVGGVCGSNGGIITSCYNSGTVSGNFDWVGGVCGSNSGTITSCYNTGSVSGHNQVGGVCGYNSSTITGCYNYNTGAVSGNDWVGGVCGENDSTITGCYNTSEVRGNNSVGGVCGSNSGTITSCYNTGTVSGNFDWVGGVCGSNGGKITGCYNTGSVSGHNQVGGVCGYNSSTITGCYNYNTGAVSGSKDVSGSSYVGGVCGENNGGTITGCYTNNGGVCGYNEGTVTYCEVKTDDDFTKGTVCTLLNTALKKANASVRFYQGANYPEFIKNLPSLVGDVYQISNKEELYAFAQLVNNGETNANAVLTANITVNTGVLKSDGTLNNNGSGFEPWTPIGFSFPYEGTFDGQGHTISGLYFKDVYASYVGLFSYSSGTIRNVGVIDSYFKGSDYIGGVCGYNHAEGDFSQATIENCYNTGTVSGNFDTVGGVCGSNGGKITGCYNTGTVSGKSNVGGVCGYGTATIENCYNTGSVSGNIYIGGVCGYNHAEGKYPTVTIENCYNTGTVSGYDNVGGVCGYNHAKSDFSTVTIENCYNTGTVSCNGHYAGGVCGYNYAEGEYSTATIENCYNTGTVSGSGSNVGGVCGANQALDNCTAPITNCYYNSEKYTGNAIGTNDGTVTNVEGKTTAQFMSGEVCYLMNNGITDGTLTWHQNIDMEGATKDLYPVLDNTHGVVYQCSVCTRAYSNTEGAKGAHDYVDDGNGFLTCKACGTKSYQPATLNASSQYEISNAGQLYWFAALVNGELGGETQNTSANAVLTANITVNTGVLDSYGNLNNNGSGFETWTPIGNAQNSYTGTFDGQGHTISGLYSDNSVLNNVGFFGRNRGTIKNVGVVDSYFYGSGFVGGVCGLNGGTITGCYNTGTVSGSSSSTGGVCGSNEGGTITGCYNTGSVSGSDYSIFGGVCGGNGGTITNCYYLASNDDGNGGKTNNQFKSGEVCYLLSQGSTVTDGENTTYYSGASWGQQLGTDDYPVLSDYKVIKAAEGANKTYWATFSNQSSDMDLSNLTAYTATVSKGILTLTPCTNHIVAKGEGVLVKGNSEYLNALMLNDDTEKPEENNDLVATPAEPTVINAATGHVLYRLTYNKVSTKEGLGFYLGLVGESKDGSQLKATPNKAYLDVTTEAATPSSSNMPALGFAFPSDGETTGISEMVIKGNAGISGAANADGRIYNLQGLQVSAPAKGLYIKNNKKVIVK